MGDVTYGGDYSIGLSSYSSLDVSTAPLLSGYSTYGTAANYSITVQEVTVTAPSHSPTVLEWIDIAGQGAVGIGLFVVGIGTLQSLSIIGTGTGVPTIAAGTLLSVVGGIAVVAVAILRDFGFQ
jgi:hypothetical protein